MPQTGQLDLSFGTQGITVLDMANGAHDEILDIGLQSDGSILAVCSIDSGIVSRFNVVRYNADGTPDGSFGTGGLVSTALGTGNSFAYAIAVQPDDKFVLVGRATMGTPTVIAVLRYLPDGSLDPDFGAAGVALIEASPNVSVGTAVCVEATGRILVCGGANDSFCTIRLLANGVLDPGFGNSGVVITSFPQYSSAHTISLQPDGAIVVGGYVDNADQGFDIALVRYLGDGTADPSFGSNGSVYTANMNTIYDRITDIEIQPDGKILAVATSESPRIHRYMVDGTIDPTFLNWGSGSVMRLQPNGKVLKGSSTYDGSGVDYTVERILGSGETDTSFFGTGYVSVDIGSGSSAQARALVVQPDGKIIQAGSSSDGVQCDQVLVRYLAPSDVSVGDFATGTRGLRLAPNPSTDWVVVSLPRPVKGAVQLELCDQVGRIIGAEPFKQLGVDPQQWQLDVTSLSSGVYTVRAQSSEWLASARLVKE